MKKIIFLFALLTTICAQSQHEILKDIGSFTELKVFDKIQLTLIKSDKNEVKITGIKRREVVVVQNGNLLKIRMSLNNLWDTNNTKVVVYYTNIHKIDVNEGARVEAKDVLFADHLDLRAQEGGSILAQIETGFLYTKTITGGEIEVHGKAEEQEAIITSGGQYYAKPLKTLITQVKVSAGGIAEVHAKKYVKANTNAGGTIKIYGNPKEIDSQKLLGGKILEIN